MVYTCRKFPSCLKRHPFSGAHRQKPLVRLLDMAPVIGKRGKERMTAQVAEHCGRSPGCDCERSGVVMHVVGIKKTCIIAVTVSRTLALKPWGVGWGGRKEGRRGGKGGADILIYYLKVGSLYRPSEYMHINKIAHENMQSIL